MPRSLLTIGLTVALGCGIGGGCARPATIAPRTAGGPAPAPATAAVAGVAAPPWTDSAAHGPQVEIYRTWLRYLGSSGGRYRRAAFTPSPDWLASEQREWHVYALALSYLPDGALPEILSIEPVPEPAGEYRVTTRFTSATDANAMRSRVVTVTVFAVPSAGGWVLANALPRLTRTWRRDTVGPITYVMAPGYPFNHDSARHAAAFVDSLAGALGVPRLERLTYFLTASDDELYRIMGLETDKYWGPVGGVAQPTNYMLFSGIPAVGEDYRHELTHVVILPLMTGRTTYFVSEGVPTWLGGTTGMDLRTAARGLATYLHSHPDVGLDSILDGRYPVAEFYPAAGVFVGMVYAHGGTDAVLALFDSGPTTSDFRSAMEKVFGRPWATIAADWRRQVLSFTPRPAGPR